VPRSTGPGTLRWAVRILLVEGAAVAVLTGFLVYAAFTRPSVSFASAASSVGFFLGLAALLALLGWQLSRRQAWARGVAIVLELLAVPIGGYLVTGGAAWAGVPVLFVGLAGTVLLLAPSSREALGIH
jgi:peptidoglycan/LPS O-acetylase OafA/YrhL